MIKGNLFTQNFLAEGITEYQEWQSLPEQEIAHFQSRLRALFQDFPVNKNPNEDTTEKDVIEPILKELGWGDFLAEQHANRFDIPDYLLFDDKAQKQKANQENQPEKRYKHGRAVLEAKKWNLELDRKSSEAFSRIPSNQIIRYLTNVDVASEGGITWGMLTNGRLWRLYFGRAQSKSEDFVEFDLAAILGLEGFQKEMEFDNARHQDWLKVFYLLFQKPSFQRHWEGKTFHELILEQGKFWELKVTENLSDTVFKHVYPGLLNTLFQNDPKASLEPDLTYLEELRTNALTLLYRLLFILYAEDRDLLPIYNDRYDDYGLRKRVREDVANRIDADDTFSQRRDDYYHHVRKLFDAIDQGDESIGLPPYNGGLFNLKETPLLERVEIPDADFAVIIDDLSRRSEGDRKRWINYRDLSVQQLGAIYERLLEFYPTIDENFQIILTPNTFARKSSGSYYTPDELVQVILKETVGPLIEEQQTAFTQKIEELRSSSTPIPQKHKALQKVDPATQILNLKVCDPAMGSGHFLVSLVDYLADQILSLIDKAENEVPWADEQHPYQSPLNERIQNIRDTIKEKANSRNWEIKEEQLDDRHIIRRMILKRCVYGVDKNPMAVELAKVSLWLHTFTVGAPLSFLDHHLRCGDSLFGEWVKDVQDELRNRGNLLSNQTIQSAKQSAEGMIKVENLTDADIAEVETSATTFETVERATRPLNRFLQLYHALRWLENGDKERKKAINNFLDGSFGDVIEIAENFELPYKKGQNAELFEQLLEKASQLIDDQKFFNWEVAFPTIWDNWEKQRPRGGFDAVIGNPPWDRMEFEEVHWFESRNREIASADGNTRKKLIQQLKENNEALWQEYQNASQLVDQAAKLIRKGNNYNYFSKGKLNLYTLFLERAHQIIRDKGMVGLLIPTGSITDKRSSKFIKEITDNKRIKAIYDFENKKIFFPEIDSRIKFCIFIGGGTRRNFDQVDMTFFLHSTQNIKNSAFSIAHKDFQLYNPNTTTAPIFRTNRDALITHKIYEENPVFHDHKKGKVWPVTYMQMFNMTSDSHLFKTATALGEEGFYPVAGNKMKKGNEEFWPLYTGRMIHHYNHRASSVATNEENLHNAALSENVTEQELRNPNSYPVPQYWISKDIVKQFIKFSYFIGFRDIARSTDARTVISTVVPGYGCGNKLPVLIPENDEVNFAEITPLLIANLNSFVLDYVARQKIQSSSLNLYILEQLPLIAPEKFERELGDSTVKAFIKEQVLRLTYTAWDMQPFAEDMGYEGEPFTWDEEDRAHRKAKLDALFFNLYGIEEDDAAYILSTFPIVQRQDEQQYGYYRTKDLILGYMKALWVGDTESVVEA